LGRLRHGQKAGQEQVKKIKPQKSHTVPSKTKGILRDVGYLIEADKFKRKRNERSKALGQEESSRVSEKSE